MLDRAGHAGGQAAHRGDAAARGRGGGRFRGGLRRDHPQCLRHVCHAPYARLWHHQRAARLDQGRRLASRPVQPARDAEGGRHGRGRAELADDLRSAASHGLLRRHRRRRRHDRDHAGNRQEPEEAAGAVDRPWRGDEGSRAAARISTSLIPPVSGRARARSRKPASRRRTSSTPRSTTASPSRC